MHYVLLNGQLVPASEARVSVRDRGFRYGDGAFETIAVHGGRPWRLDWHLGRLARGLAAIRIGADLSALSGGCRELLHKNAVTDGLLRLQVTRGDSGRGYLPDPQAAPTILIETGPLPERPQQPVSLWLSGYRKISPQALPIHYKLCQGLNSTLARMEAADHGCFDALLLDGRGHLAETSVANLFWLKDDVLYTPAPSCGVLEGSARDAVLKLSPYAPREVETGLDALAGADAVFITNVAWKALPVKELLPEGMRWNSEAAARTFHRLLMDDTMR